MLKLISAENVNASLPDPVNAKALEQARAIVNRVKRCHIEGPDALIEIAVKFGELKDSSQSYVVPMSECKRAFEGLSDGDRRTLLNICNRVRIFAEAQRNSIGDAEITIPGGRAGHTVSPCATAGCYAPGGRYPLPSSVVMTAMTAKAAGVQNVVVASPRPAPITLAAAYASGADKFLCVGGAQAVAAMAYGVKGRNAEENVPPCDVIVGPGNQWVTAAKYLVMGYCGIDMLAGPSEVLAICDHTANPEVVAADLIAQAEHDVVARPILISSDKDIIDRVNAAVARQIATMPQPNQDTARQAFTTGFAVLCSSVEECVRVSDSIAPEHLEIQTEDAMRVAMSCRNYGGLFVGEGAAEVLGDYGAGPNHTLPTGGTGKYTGGLSVFNFLRIRTWMRVDDRAANQSVVRDSVRMARLEGLEGHARSAEHRLLSRL